MIYRYRHKAHWSSIGARDATGAEILAYAKGLRFTVLSHYLDFRAILAAMDGESPSFVQIRAGDPSTVVIALLLHISLHHMPEDL